MPQDPGEDPGEDPGRVAGTLMIFWVGEDDFVHYPYTADPLRYYLPPRLAERLGAEAIRPGAVYTDGGSIPRAVRVLAGFSPWGYGPAYVVHDWLFAARACLNAGRAAALDPRDRDEAALVARMRFADSAAVLRGMVAALMAQGTVPQRRLAPAAIYTAVGSFLARRRWERREAGVCRPVAQGDLAAIEAALDRPAARPDLGPPSLVLAQRF